MNIQVNDCVTILGHVGIVDDIAKSENGRTLILWRSLKGIWNHHRNEWIDITEDTIAHIRPTTKKDLEKDSDYYAGHCFDSLEDQMNLLEKELALFIRSKGE